MEIKNIRESGLRWSVFYIGVLLCFLASPSNAQHELNPRQKLSGEAPSIRFEQIGLEDGLNQVSIFDITQDKQGYLWMTTEDGLHRYDGYEFKIYSYTPFDSTSLASGVLHAVEAASNGDLWITVDGLGIQRMNRTTEVFSSFLNDPEDSTSLSSSLTWDVKEGRNGDLWVSTTEAGLNQMKAGEDGKFLHYRHDPDDPESLTSDIIFRINEDPEGMIWVGSMNGMSRVDPETGEVKRFFYQSQRPEKYHGEGSVLNQYFPPGQPGISWLATGKGLVRLDTETGEYERFLVDQNEDPFNQLNVLQKIIADPSEPNILWVAGPGTGIARFDTRTGKFTSYRHNPGDPHSLGDDDTETIFADRTGKIWIGLRSKGLSTFNPGAVNFSHLRYDSRNTESLAPGAVFGIYEDQLKNLWIGTSLTSGGYVSQINSRTGKIIRHQHDPKNPASLVSGTSRVFTEDGSGNFWIGSTNGLMQMDRETGRVTHFVHQPIVENMDRNNINVLFFEEENPNQLWIGHADGLDILDMRAGKFTPVPISPVGNQNNPHILSSLRSKEGSLWIGTNKHGLYRLDRSGVLEQVTAYDPQDSTTISSNFINGIHEREQEPGILWLATGGGLNRFNSHTGIAKHYVQKDGLPNNIIYGILEDSNGNLWMSTNRGISNFDPEDGTFRNYGLDDGLMALEYNQFALTKGSDGTLYFGSAQGVTGFLPEKLAINEIPPQVVLSGLKVFNKEVAPGPGSLLEQPLSDTKNITLDYDQNEITFDFVALHFSNASKNVYAYMLEGFDQEWVNSGTRHSATYTNLAPGSYKFRVKAANPDGIWSEEEASVQLSVLPPWYRTWWAYGIFVLILALIVFGIDKFQRQRLKKQEKERRTLQEAELRAEAENRRRADTEQLSNIGRAITSSLSITKIIDTVYGHVNELMDAAIFGIGIYNPEKERLDFPATKENGKMLKPYVHGLQEENRLAVWCFNNSKEIIIGDTAREYSNYINTYLPPVKGNDSQSVMYLPLIQQGRTIGVITTQSFTKNAFTAYHIQLLRNLATYAAIALDNASAYRKLNSTLNDLKLMQEQLVQQEKLASLGQLTAGIAHEIKNPLNFVNNFSELSVELIDETREELQKLKENALTTNDNFIIISELLDDIENNLKRIHKHGTRADGIVRSMLQHSRGGSRTMQPVKLNELIKEYVNLAYHGMRAGKQPINVEMDFKLDEQAGKIPLIEEDFSRVIINLCNNAFEAMREKTLLSSTNQNYLPILSIRTLKQNGSVKLEFKDNGPGIAEENRDKILQPFFTTKRGTEGTGLGLSITNDIIHVHGGSLSIESTMGNGSCFSINLPQAQQVGTRESDIEIN